MPYHLKSGQTAEEAAFLLLGDKRLVNELQIIHGIAYVRGEKLGPPAKWAAAPLRLRNDAEIHEISGGPSQGGGPARRVQPP